MSLAPGTRLGPYEIVAPLGAGGMGEVYRARDPRLNREVAVKVLPERFAEDADRLARFRAEALSTGAVNHPNILAIYDVGSEGRNPYLVCELLDGMTLRERLAKGPLSPRKAVEYCIQIAKALASAHERGVIHRDLKPENIFITRDGHLKLLDFGLAKLELEDGQSDIPTLPANTRPGIAVGTLGYMAPEQLRGEKVDGRADLFALGAVFLEMISGTPAFMRQTAPATIDAVLREDPVQLRENARALSPALERVVARCVEKQPGERFRSAADLAHSLEAIVASWSEERPLQPAARPRWWPVAAAMAIAFVAIFTWLIVRPDRTLPGASGAPAASPIASLAILPFHPVDRTGAQDVLTVGLADTIINKLSQVGDLTIRPTSAIRKYGGGDVDPLAAAKELGVDAVVDGSLQRWAGRLRVNVNVLRAADGRSMWADSFDMPEGEIFRLQDTVASRLAEALHMNVSPAGRRNLAKRYTSNSEAYEYHAKGMELFDKRIGSYDRLQEAIPWFEKAIAADPQYALAHAHLGYSYLWIALFTDPDNPDWLTKAKGQLNEAQRLDPTLAETYVARHDLLWSAAEGFQIDQAVRELQAAQKLDPSVGHSELATLYYHLGLEEPAIRELERALEIDPLSEVNRYHMVEGLTLLGRYDEAIAASNRYFNRRGPVLALIWSGRAAEAEQLVEEGLREERNSLRSVKARLLALKGLGGEAEKAVREALALASDNNRAYHHTTYDVATVYALLGRPREAVQWLKVTVDKGMPNLPLFERDPHLDRIRSSAEYRAFIDELRPRWDRHAEEFN